MHTLMGRNTSGKFLILVEVDFSDRAADFRNLNTLDELQRWERDHRG